MIHLWNVHWQCSGLRPGPCLAYSYVSVGMVQKHNVDLSPLLGLDVKQTPQLRSSTWTQGPITKYCYTLLTKFPHRLSQINVCGLRLRKRQEKLTRDADSRSRIDDAAVWPYTVPARRCRLHLETYFSVRGVLQFEAGGDYICEGTWRREWPTQWVSTRSLRADRRSKAAWIVITLKKVN